MFKQICAIILSVIVSVSAWSSWQHEDRVSLYGSSNETYFDALYFNLQNLRYAESTVAKPKYIFFPKCIEDVQELIRRAVDNEWTIRARSGGHAYEGQSSTSDSPFIIIDLRHLNHVHVDVSAQKAFVGGGATLGEVYYEIAKASNGSFGFSAGSCPTVGVGGHISGGGFGLLSRKFGLAADNVQDALFINWQGQLFNRATMGEDLFWSLRGGGGGNFGIVVQWAIQILPVPAIVSIFNKNILGLKNAVPLVHKWQTVAANAPKDLYVSVFNSGINSTTENHRRPGKDRVIEFQSVFHGQSLLPKNATLALFDDIFPELGITSDDILEMSWIDAVVFFSGLPANASVTDLLIRFNPNKSYFKAKSDYVQTPIPVKGLLEAFRFLDTNPNGYMLMDPYGGKMAEIPVNATAFPHRAGNLYSIQYQAVWNSAADDAHNIAWIQDLYAITEPYVSMNPRSRYYNYLDFDAGTSNNGTASVAESQQWGLPYWGPNYARLVELKKSADPYNAFRNPQSIGIDLM